jgi:hypothetical protein
MKADAPFAGAPGVVVLHPESPEDPHGAVVHADGDAENVFTKGIAQELARGGVEMDVIGHPIELRLRHLEWAERFVFQWRFPIFPRDR